MIHQDTYLIGTPPNTIGPPHSHTRAGHACPRAPMRVSMQRMSRQHRALTATWAGTRPGHRNITWRVSNVRSINPAKAIVAEVVLVVVP